MGCGKRDGGMRSGETSTTRRGERKTSFPSASRSCVQPAIDGVPTSPYPAAAAAEALSLLNVIRRMFGAYGSSTIVLPSRSRTKWVSWASAASLPMAARQNMNAIALGATTATVVWEFCRSFWWMRERRLFFSGCRMLSLTGNAWLWPVQNSPGHSKTGPSRLDLNAGALVCIAAKIHITFSCPCKVADSTDYKRIGQE